MVLINRIRIFLTKHIGGHGILKVGGGMTALRGLSTLSGIVLSILLARGLGPEGYGRYLYAVAVAHMLAMPLLAGLPTLLMRQIAVYRGAADWAGLRGVLRWALRLVRVSTVGVLFVGAACYVLLGAFGTQADPLIFLALPLVVCLVFMHLASAILRGFEYPLWGSLPDGTIRPLLLLGFVGLFAVSSSLSPVTAILAHSLAASCALLWAWRMCNRHCLGIPEAEPRLESRAWFASLIPLGLTTGAALINRRLDVFVLGLLSTKPDVAIYGLASQMAGVSLIGQTIVNSIIGPRLARMNVEEDNEGLQKLMNYCCRLSSLGAFVVLTFLVFLGEETILLLVGTAFTGSSTIAIILGVGYFFSASMGPVALLLNMTGHEVLTMKIVSGSALANAILNVCLVPEYGAVGAASATLASVLIRQSLLAGYVYKRLKIRTPFFLFGRRRSV